MPDPTRPVAGAPIDTDWGQQVHDNVFQPRGVRASGSTHNSVGSAYEQLPIDVADDDPGGWLSGDTLTVPTGGGGLYSWSLRVSVVNGTASQRTIVQMRQNSAAYMQWRIDHEAGTVFDQVSGIDEFAAGDEFQVWAAKTGGVLNPDVRVRSFSFIKLGTSIGA